MLLMNHTASCPYAPTCDPSLIEGRRKEAANRFHHLQTLCPGHSRLETGTRAHKCGRLERRSDLYRDGHLSRISPELGGHVNWFHSRKCERGRMMRLHSRLSHKHGNCLGEPGPRYPQHPLAVSFEWNFSRFKDVYGESCELVKEEDCLVRVRQRDATQATCPTNRVIV
jgi:hypothetical protein